MMHSTTCPCGALPAKGLSLRRPVGARISTKSSRTTPSLPRRNIVSAAQASEVPDPFATKEVYNDGPLTKFFCTWFSKQMSKQLGEPCPEDITYEKFIEVGRRVIQTKSPLGAQEVVMGVLNATMPPGSAEKFRRWFPLSQWSAEFNAWLTTIGFMWLVGPCELEEADIPKEDGSVEVWNSRVHIKKCRYLETSGCTGMCVNMCKIPTQKFFTEDFGLPVTMKPNFEDLSCDMIFGEMPPSIEDDEAFKQPCFAAQCSVASKDLSAPCHRLPPIKSEVSN
ncbi:hypothetical protein BSKO_03501 [Bryopsis sp. KO-2023]|nr:hypothetical protein BSKO_03501 [Bryopsis sp. KO-2023]